MSSSESKEVSAPDWLDRTFFPFQSRRIHVSRHSIHYIDEGSGPILLMLHGNGSWSYGFRHVFSELSTRFRVVPLDLLGFGLSIAAAGFSFKPANQSAVVEAFVNALQLTQIRLFVENWGGPIGPGFAGRRPELIHSLFISNTWAWPAQGIASIERFSKLAGGAVGRFLITRFNVLEKYAIPNMMIARRMSAVEGQGYWTPYPTPESRRPQTIFPRELLESYSYLKDVESGLERLKERPVLILWGEKDPGFSEDELVRFLEYFPLAPIVLLPEATHFVMVDKPEKCAAAIFEFEGPSGSPQ